MKNVALFFVFSFVLTVNGNAQTASATWALIADTAVVVTGNVAAPGQVLSKTPVATDTMAVKDYINGIGPSGSPVVAEMIWLDGTGWPQESLQNNGRYIQFSVSPLTGNSFTIQSIAMKIGCLGSNGHFFANIYYSLDFSFTTLKKLTSAPLTLPDVRTVPLSELSYSPTVVVNDGQIFYVRVYPWYDTTAKNPAIKYICLASVVITGNTAVQTRMTKVK